jgi:3-oxoacyl-[acyl-carrier protein] reductase
VSSDSLIGQAAVVTGGSRGIGRAVALELARCGASVVVSYRERRDLAEAVAGEIEAKGGRACAVQADVVDETQVRRLVATAVHTFGRLDVLVCSAGVVRDQLAGALSLADWDAVIQTNLRGAFLCMREALPHMLPHKRGSIVGVSSVAADLGGRGHCNYAASKGGLNAMIRSLAVELAPKRIRVNGVAPGVIVTDMTRRIRDLAGDAILKSIPLRRYGDPDDVARAVRFLASPDANYITGEILHVTGGLGL